MPGCTMPSSSSVSLLFPVSMTWSCSGTDSLIGAPLLPGRLYRTGSSERAGRYQTLAPARALPAQLDRYVRALRGARVDLTRPADLGGRALDHLLPVREPAGQTADREQHREH